MLLLPTWPVAAVRERKLSVPQRKTSASAHHCVQFNAHGVTMDGGFAEYCAYPAAKVFKIHNLNWVDATLLEPASCACHGLEKIRPKLGSHVLMFGAGPTGLVGSYPRKLPDMC